MDLTPGQRRLAFVVVVLALAGLGIYLVGARGTGGTPAAARSTAPATPAAATSSSAAGVPPTMLPSATPVSTAGGAEIYQWLPFTPADLTAAANATTAFAKAYATWSYTESAKAYGATFRGLATPAQITSLEDGYSTPGLAQQRTADKWVSTGSGTIDSIRAFGAGPASITFVVTITNQVTGTQPSTMNGPQQYAVTVESASGAWLVNDIQLSSLGNP
jgi:hypothetical protein